MALGCCAGRALQAFTSTTFWWLERYTVFREHLEAHYGRVRETEAYRIFELRGVRMD
ncbi:MAG TPA: hypothetical protein VLK82_27530 [Candidatus Tectomicrobia bacterium]|nr:hypothetical protein [Candidatus Tectomicrobia bacterium]